MNPSEIAISIVTYNSKDIFKTLDNLQKEILPNFKATVYLFDNNSNDAFKEKLKSYAGPQVKINFYGDNKGFGFGHNTNMQEATEPYVLICNPDILVSQESFSTLYEYLKQTPDILLAPKVVNTDGSTQYLVRRRLAVFDYVLRFIPFKFVKKMFNKRLAYFECRDLTDEIQEINYASGCFMFTRKSDYDEVGEDVSCLQESLITMKLEALMMTSLCILKITTSVTDIVNKERKLCTILLLKLSTFTAKKPIRVQKFSKFLFAP